MKLYEVDPTQGLSFYLGTNNEAKAGHVPKEFLRLKPGNALLMYRENKLVGCLQKVSLGDIVQAADAIA